MSAISTFKSAYSAINQNSFGVTHYINISRNYLIKEPSRNHSDTIGNMIPLKDQI